jgi:hypothetical protein
MPLLLCSFPKRESPRLLLLLDDSKCKAARCEFKLADVEGATCRLLPAAAPVTLSEKDEERDAEDKMTNTTRRSTKLRWVVVNVEPAMVGCVVLLLFLLL